MSEVRNRAPLVGVVCSAIVPQHVPSKSDVNENRTPHTDLPCYREPRVGR
jgi:hypothetical protein